MAITISPANHADANPKESQRTYYEQYLKSLEVAGPKVSPQPPPHVHQPTFMLSSPERRMSMKSIELLKDQNCGRIL